MMEKKLRQQAANLAPFSNTPKKMFDRAMIFFQHLHYRIGKNIFYQEDWAEHIYFILSGKIQCKKWRSNESNFLLSTEEKGHWLGLAETISRGVYLCDSECLTSVDVLIMHHSHLPALLEMDVFRRHLISSLARGYYSIHNTLSAPGSLELIVRYLKRLSSNTSNINITQEEIAHAIGITRETVSKHLNQLQKDRILTLSRGKILIHDLTDFENI